MHEISTYATTDNTTVVDMTTAVGDIWTYSDDVIVTSIRSRVQPWFVWMYGSMCMIGALGIFGNSLTIVAFAKFAKLRKSTNYLLFNLAVCDLTGSFAHPLIAFVGYIPLGMRISSQYKYACLMPLWTILVARGASLLALIAISFERLIAVIYPLKHMTIVRKKTVTSTIYTLWAFILLCITPSLFGLDTWSS